MNVEAIKEAIAGLPEDDKLSLAAWLNLQTMDEWDKLGLEVHLEGHALSPPPS